MDSYHEELSSNAWSVWQRYMNSKHLLLKALSYCQTFVLLTAGFFTFDMSWNLSTNLSKNHALQCLFVRGSNKKQKRGRIISNFTKVETFSSLMTTKYSWGLSHNAVPLFAPIKKSFFSPSVWAGKHYTWTLNWKENLLIYFENCQDVPYSLE